MPEPLWQTVHPLVSEVVMHCQEVLRYTEPDVARDWKRMTLIRWNSIAICGSFSVESELSGQVRQSPGI